MATQFKVTVQFSGDRRYDDPIITVVTAETPEHARLVALRRYYNNPDICTFIPYNPFPGQDPSGQAGYGYEQAPEKSGADLASATPMIRVTMDPIPRHGLESP